MKCKIIESFIKTILLIVWVKN